MSLLPRRHRVGVVVHVLPVALLALAGCGEAGGPTTGATPPQRPADGLLTDAELQAVLEEQTARDAAALVLRLSSPRPEVRARAAFALASVQDTSAVEALLGALGDPGADVRRDAAFALGQSGAVRAVSALAGAYGGEADDGVRRRILEALGKIRSVSGAQALAELAVAPGDEAERVLALARIGAVRGVMVREGQDLILRALTAPDAPTRLHAAYYFGRLPSAEAWSGEAERVREALAGYAADDPAAMYLIQALGRLADAQDGGRLRAWLTSAPDWRTRANAAAALGGLPPDAESRASLLAALDDPSAHVAIAAAQSLARGTPVPSERQRMMTWIDANPDRWQAAAPLLVVLAQGDEREFVFRWIDALAADDALRWSAGLRALAFVPGEEGLERLREAASSADRRVQGAALDALLQRWNQDRAFAAHHELYFRILAQALESESRQAQGAAAQALGDPLFARFGSAGVLVEAYRKKTPPEDVPAMTSLVEVLGRVEGAAVEEVLDEAALSPYPALRAAATAGLEARGRRVPPFGGEDAAAERGGAQGERPALDWSYLASLGAAPRLVLETDVGTVRIRLVPEEAPLTVQTLARLAAEGRFDGVAFHRVVPNFVVQGGDVGPGDGSGGPGFAITSEFTLIPFWAGVAGMASAGKDTEGSQFFLTHSMQPHLDGGYTTFGWVTAGWDVMDRIQVGNRIVRASVEPGS